MTSYFEYNAKKPESDLIEPDDTLCDTGVFVEHSRMGDDTYKMFMEAFRKHFGEKQ